MIRRLMHCRLRTGLPALSPLRAIDPTVFVTITVAPQLLSSATFLGYVESFRFYSPSHLMALTYNWIVGNRLSLLWGSVTNLWVVLHSSTFTSARQPKYDSTQLRLGTLQFMEIP